MPTTSNCKGNKLSDMPDFNDPGKLGSGKEMVERPDHWHP
jgi:hypothetical protein